MSKATRRLTAARTIDYGTPKQPASAAPGEDFDCPADEAQGLIDRGIATEAKAAVAPPPPSPSSPSTVEIPADWAQLNAADLVRLARDLGAPSTVNRKDEAHEFVTKVAADRAAAPPTV